MAQDEETLTTSRHNFLAAAAIAGAIVAPSVAVAANKPHPDAELIRLGKRYDEVVQEYEATATKLRPLYDEHARRMREWIVENPQDNGIDAYERLWKEVGLNAACKDSDPDDITDEMDPLCRRIMAIPAMTMAGLLVKARVAKYNARILGQALPRSRLGSPTYA